MLLDKIRDVVGARRLPNTVVTDFESGIFDAITNVMIQNVNTRGCYFHLCQSTFRKIQDLGLKNAYINDPAIQLFCCQ